MNPDPKPYLEYLDKEMTIMGILSAFSMTLASLVTAQIVTASDSFVRCVWDSGRLFVLAGAAVAVIASFLFYWQRSHLAWYYGAIALAQVLDDPKSHSVTDLLKSTDEWPFWARYHLAFVALASSFGYYACAVAVALDPRLAQVGYQGLSRWLLLVVLPITSLVGSIAYWQLLKALPRHPDPIKYYWRHHRRVFAIFRGMLCRSGRNVG